MSKAMNAAAPEFRPQSSQQRKKADMGQSNNLHGGRRPKRKDNRGGSSNQRSDGRKTNRGQSGNHLLNFRYDRDVPERSVVPPEVSRARASSAYVAPYSRERFVQATFRFMVRRGEHYTVHTCDPDRLADWNFVEEVQVFSHEVTKCPICLDSPPSAPKITTCGHIFCWPCILQHLSYSKYRRLQCPVCPAIVDASELKSVTVNHVHRFDVGDEIRFILLRRQRGTITPRRVDSVVSAEADAEKGSTECTCIEDDEMKADDFLSSLHSDAIFSKLCYMDHVSELLGKEERQLKACKDEAANMGLPSHPFVLLAIDDLKSRRAASRRSQPRQLQYCTTKSNVAHHNPNDLKSPQQKPLSPQDLEPFAACDAPKSPQNMPCSPQDAVPPIEGSSTINSDSSPASDFLHFYQPADGQLLFLHPINVRCLTEAYGKDGSEWPQVVDGKIVEVEWVTISPEVRKRYSFLRHLPLSCTIGFVEVNLSHILSPEVLKKFQAVFEERVKVRSQRRRTEKKIEDKNRKIEMRERQKLVQEYQPTPAPEYNLTHFPLPPGSCANAPAVSSDSISPMATSEADELAASDYRQMSSPSSARHDGGGSSSEASGFSYARITSEGGYFPTLVSSSPCTYPPLPTSSSRSGTTCASSLATPHFDSSHSSTLTSTSATSHLTAIEPADTVVPSNVPICPQETSAPSVWRGRPASVATLGTSTGLSPQPQPTKATKGKSKKGIPLFNSAMARSYR